MGEFLEELRELIKGEVARYGMSINVSKESMTILKEKEVVMTIRDLKDYVELSYKGKKYSYDKWYTKPQHLASTIMNTLKVQEKPTG